MIMDFKPNIILIEVIKKGAFGGTYFRDMYSSITNKWYKNSWKEFDELKNIDQKSIIAQIIMMLVLINMVLNVEHHYDFGKIKDGFILLIRMVGFSGILRYWLGRRSVDDKRH